MGSTIYAGQAGAGLSDLVGGDGDSFAGSSSLPVVVARWSRLRSLTAAPTFARAALKNLPARG